MSPKLNASPPALETVPPERGGCWNGEKGMYPPPGWAEGRGMALNMLDSEERSGEGARQPPSLYVGVVGQEKEALKGN